ncbi:DNA binding protein [Mycobacterium phage Babsiella]|uniref:Uncharacterized protein n=1 Tax=Mycobacterium phage Babsiella TaxID=2902842 RepID=G8I6U4_9CAUD|nr:DNA binding protein [Mycobacterium phage Babsiella]AER48438.1 hypothetical protein BABSIELLA_61 [Mycobacterium phage Babsiella]
MSELTAAQQLITAEIIEHQWAYDRDGGGRCLGRECADWRGFRAAHAEHLAVEIDKAVGGLAQGTSGRLIWRWRAGGVAVIESPAPAPVAKPQTRQRKSTTPVTARCRDCPRTWNLTGRVLKLTVELHEHQRGHVVDIEEGALDA